MPNFYGSNYPDPTKALVNPVDMKGARLRNTQTDVTPATIPAAADQIFLCRLPSNARLNDVGKITYAAFGGACAANLGLQHPTMTAAQITAAAAVLWSAQSLVAAGNRQVMFGVTLANLGKRLWELTGLAKDPGGEIDLVLVFTVVAAATGRIYGDVTFTTD